MKFKIIAIILVLIFPLLTYPSNKGKAKTFGIAGFAFSIIAIGADIYADHYYDKYEKATIPSDCEHYRNRTVLCERARDVSFGLAAISFTVSTIYLLKNEKSDIGLEINFKKERLCVGLTKSLY